MLSKSKHIKDLNLMSTKSDQDYLETILLLRSRNEHVRAVDISRETGFTKPSVSVAMKKLKANGLIEIIDNRIILTSEGEEIARKIYERHEIIASLLMTIGVSKEQAYDDSCLIEHIISEESFLAIKSYWEKVAEKKYVKEVESKVESIS